MRLILNTETVLVSTIVVKISPLIKRQEPQPVINKGVSHST